MNPFLVLFSKILRQHLPCLRSLVVALAILALASSGWASPKAVDLRFYGHMCADVQYTVTMNGVTLNGDGQGCQYYSDTAWGTAKVVPDQVYTISTSGALCSAHIPFEKKCLRLFVKGYPYDDWTEVDQIDKQQTFTDGVDANGNQIQISNKDAGGSWQIVLTSREQPSFGSGSNQLGSVAISLSLGSLPNGSPAGKLILATENIGATIYTPAALQVMSLSADVEVLRVGANVRQIHTWDGLANVVSVTGGFEVRFYSLADVGAKGQDGYYTINGGATAILTWSFLNPDATATNRLKVSEQRPGTAVAFNTYAQTGSAWNLQTGTGTQVRSTIAKTQTTIGGEPVEVVMETRYSSPVVFETATTRTYTALATAHLAEKLHSVEYPDGRKDSFVYEKGTYVDANRTFSVGTGTYLRTASIHGMVAMPGLLAGKSTQDVIVTNAEGFSVLEEFYTYPSSAFILVTQTWHTYNSGNHLTASTRDGQPVYNATWNFDGKTSETDETGIKTTILYDGDYYFDLIKTGVAASGSYPAQSDVERNGSRGDYSSETVSAGSFTTFSDSSYNNGRLSYETRNGLQTNYAYDTSQDGGLITTVTLPGGATEIREEYSDGKLKCVTGTAVSPFLYYTYGTDAGGNEWTQINYGAATSPNYLITTTDWLGRTLREERPAYTGLFVRQYFYNAQGQLWKESATGLANRLNEFDAMGNQVRSGLDMDGNGSLGLASTD